MPPENENGPRSTTSQGRSETNADQTQALRVTVPRQTDRRHALGQTSLPIVAALAFPPQPGMKLAVLIVEQCPHCDWWHRHSVTWPTKKLLDRRGRCGGNYTLVPYVRRRKKAAR